MALSAFLTRDWPEGLQLETAEWTALKLSLPMPTFAAQTTCAEVFDWFNANPAQVAAAIVDEGNRVVGLVNRLRFLAAYAKRATSRNCTARNPSPNSPMSVR